MKINELKINGFGKLENKEIKLDEHINVIYGKNEAGKSTLLKFITSMFYGISKNKNGGTIPEVEKFQPWKVDEFSGKLKYELDNKETFEIYREFKKKNPKIFNSNLEDISKEFTIDKTKGNQFFYDQTGLEEEIFTTSVITKQAEVKLDEKSQNSIIQKISNILGTGEDTTSYEKVVSKLKKKINDEIGTANTKERPINIIEKRIEQIEKEKIELEKYQNTKFEIQEEIKTKKEQIIGEKQQLETLKAANLQVNKEKAELSKIDVIKKLIEDTNRQIKDLEETSKKENANIQNKGLKKGYKILEGIFILVTILCMILLKNKVIAIIPAVITLIFGIYLIILNNKNQSRIKEEKREYKSKLRNLEANKKAQEEELSKLQRSYDNSILQICNQYKIKDVHNIIDEINQIESKINELTLKLHTMELDYQNINPKLEKFINIEEELESLKQEKVELEKRREVIKKAIDTLEIAYSKMKEEITPKFTNELSKTIGKISEGKYKNVRINTMRRNYC